MMIVHAWQASAESRESQLSSGLIIGHAYSVTDIRNVSLLSEQVGTGKVD